MPRTLVDGDQQAESAIPKAKREFDKNTSRRMVNKLQGTAEMSCEFTHCA